MRPVRVDEKPGRLGIPVLLNLNGIDAIPEKYMINGRPLGRLPIAKIPLCVRIVPRGGERKPMRLAIVEFAARLVIRRKIGRRLPVARFQIAGPPVT